MFATALMLQQTTKDAIYADQVVDTAGELLIDYHSLTLDEFTERLFTYSMIISATAVSMAASDLLGKDGMNNLVESIQEMQDLALVTMIEEMGEVE